jgi:RNAse (barnase) inhibitor barstar
MIVRIDAKRFSDAAGLLAAISEAFGFPANYGKNLDALVDCLTDLDDPKAAMSKIQLLPGQLALIVIENADAKGKQAAQMTALIDAIAFVNWRRLERGQGPVLSIAYQR